MTKKKCQHAYAGEQNSTPTVMQFNYPVKWSTEVWSILKRSIKGVKSMSSKQHTWSLYTSGVDDKVCQISVNCCSSKHLRNLTEML